MKAIVLLTPGSPGISERPRRASLDARAAELALQYTDNVVGLYAGADIPSALQLYAGMGLKWIYFVHVNEGMDVAPALSSSLRHIMPDLIFCGARAETGASQGLLPYMLAIDLGLPLLPEVTSLQISDGTVNACQRLGRGLMRTLSAPLPCIVTAGHSAPYPRQVAYGRTKQARYVNCTTLFEKRPTQIPVRLRTAPPPRRALATFKDFSGGILTMTSNRQADAVTPEDAARQIISLLQAEGFLPETTVTLSNSKKGSQT